MAMINCPECRREISDLAPACIHCGCPISSQTRRSHGPAEVANTTSPATNEPWDWRRIPNFRSRTRRSEFYAAWVASIAALWVGITVDAFLSSGFGIGTLAGAGVWAWLFFGASVNRLHDTGKSGWLILLGFVPIANIFVLVWVWFENGQPWLNDWGPPVGSHNRATPRQPPRRLPDARNTASHRQSPPPPATPTQARPATPDVADDPSSPDRDEGSFKGYEWDGDGTPILRCLDCRQMVVFPHEQAAHMDHRIAQGGGVSRY